MAKSEKKHTNNGRQSTTQKTKLNIEKLMSIICHNYLQRTGMSIICHNYFDARINSSEREFTDCAGRIKYTSLTLS
jgi:hypothetical protein